MQCRYAFLSGKNETLEKIRAWTNEQYDLAMREKKECNSGDSKWWRLQGEVDYHLKLLSKLSDLIGEKYE